MYLHFIHRTSVQAYLILTVLLLSSALVRAQDTTYYREHYNKTEAMIPMRDSVKLFISIYTPKDRSELHPIMLTRTPYSSGPYGTDKYPKFVSHLTKQYLERNYIMVTQDVRGRFMSEGTFVDVRPYVPNKRSPNDVDESSDTYDTIEWLLKNVSGNNGRVGVKGISYPGFYTTMASIDAHPAVKATSPQAPVSQWMGGDDWFHNGAFLLPHAFDFYVQIGWSRKGPTETDYRPFDHGTPDGYKFYLDLGAIPNANARYLHDSVTFWNEFTRHGSAWDDFWAARSVLPHVKNIKPATMVVGGWFDTENLFGALHLYSTIEKENPPDHWNTLVMGPWAHSHWPKDNADTLGDIVFPKDVNRFYADPLEVPFFDYYLRDRGTAPSGEAVVYLSGANEWKRLDRWPPSNIDQRKLYLAENQRLSFDSPDGEGTEFDEYVSDPAKPVPYTNEITHWYNGGFMVEDQRFASRRPDVLMYQSDVLEEPITIAGPISVHLVGSTSGTDCDWIVKLIDVFPDTMSNPKPNPRKVKYGGYEMLVRGDVLRGKFRNSLAKPEPIRLNEPTTFEFVLQDAFHQFKAGHCIMVQVQSTWFPMIDRNPGKFIDIFHAKDSDFQKTVQRVYRSGKNNSYVIVHVIR